MQHYTRKFFALAFAGMLLLSVADASDAQSSQSMPGTTTTETPKQDTTVQTTPGTTPYGQVPGASSPGDSSSSSGTTPPGSAKTARYIDLNTISASQLVRAGLDEPSAKLIEQNRPYSRPEDVLALKGLPNQTREVLKANMGILKAINPASPR